MKPTLTYLPLESYQARYTELMSCRKGWVDQAFAEKFAVTRVEPEQAPVTVIQSGSVLDSVQRPIWALHQVAQLLENTTGGRVYFDDFFHPGISALPYTGRDYQAYAFCWAQSFDRYDFTRPMVSWMRPYEAMAMAIYRKVFVASPMLADLITTVFPDAETQVEVVGLPFNSKDVAKRFDPSFHPGPHDVVFSSRFDKEKRPNFFLDLVELLPNYSFAVCTGHETLKGNDYTAVARANHLVDKGRLTIYAGLTKPQYYSVLKATKVQFNCSLQDWVAFTLLEAITHGCLPVYPAFRDFPGVFERAPSCLYAPSSQADAADVIVGHLQQGATNETKKELRAIVEYHDNTLARISDRMLGDNL